MEIDERHQIAKNRLIIISSAAINLGDIVLPTEHGVFLSIKSTAAAVIFSQTLIINGRFRIIIIRMNCAILLVLSDNMTGGCNKRRVGEGEGEGAYLRLPPPEVQWMRARHAISLILDFSQRTTVVNSS